MIYFYKVGFGSYEESHYDYLTHEKKLDLNKEIRAVIPKAFTNFSKKKNCGSRLINMGELVTEYVVPLLIKDRGFKVLSLEGEFNCFGWQGLVKDGVWKGHGGKQEELIWNALSRGGWPKRKIKELLDTKRKKKKKHQIKKLLKEKEPGKIIF